LAKDPFEALLKPITQDGKVKGGAPAWSLRCYGDFSTYNSVRNDAGKQCYGLVVVKSNTWPGSFTFFTQEKANQMVYVGDGQKFEDKTYYPVHTPKMQADPVERLTYAEPNPTATALAKKAALEAQNAANQEAY